MSCLLVSAVLVGIPARSYAQAATAALTVTVLDPSNAAVPEARVTVSSIDVGLERAGDSGPDGVFTVADLPPGAYRLTVMRAGFALAQVDVQLHVGDRAALRVPLTVGTLEDTVRVEADVPVVRQDGAVSLVVTRQFVENQPLNGRNLQSLVELAPGVVLTQTNVTRSGQFSVNGQRANANYFAIDGVSANFGVNGSATLYESAGGMLPAYSAMGGMNNLVSVDATQEFRVETSSYAAEFGRQPGAQISIVTRSGTNALRGSLFDYFRHSALDANDHFGVRNGLAKPEQRQHDFGGVLGGPIRLPGYDGRNRSFFFLSYEGLRLKVPVVSSPVLVPTVAAREAATGFARDVLMAFPLPTGSASAANPTMAPFVGSYTDPSTLDSTGIRVDHRVNGRLSMFGRFTYAPSKISQRAGFSVPNVITVSPALSQTVTVGANATFSPTLLNELRFNHSRAEFGSAWEMDDFGGGIVPPRSLFVPSFADSTAAGSITIGASPSVINFGLNAANVQRQINIVDTLTWLTGRHTWKFGVDYRRMTPTQAGASYRKLIAFSSVAQLAAGNVTGGQIIASDITLHPVYTNLSAFAQDTWRVNPRLTLTYGVRYELNPSPEEPNGNQPLMVTGLDDLSTLALAPQGTPFYDTTYGNLAPRVGVAYALTSDSRTVLRGGAGIFYDLGYAFTGAGYQTFGYPFAQIIPTVNVPLNSPTFTNPAPPVSVTPPYGRLFAFPDFKLPYTVEYNATIEHRLGASSLVSVGYVGAKGNRLGRLTSLRNTSAPIGPRFTRVDVVTNEAWSRYDSMQVQWTTRLRSGIQAVASYTLAESTDTVSDETIINFQAPSLRLDPDIDRGPSAFDVRHNVSAGVSYDLPRPSGSGALAALADGWGIDVFARARSATPINIQTNRDQFGLGFTTVSRPNVVPGVPLYLDDPSVAGGRRINLAAFTVPPTGVQGDLGRNALRGFPMHQIDLSLRRRIGLRRGANVQFRIDAFNVFNHANLANPTGVMTDPNFGVSTQMLGRSLGPAGISGGFSPLYQSGGPRSLQLSAKLQF